MSASEIAVQEQQARDVGWVPKEEFRGDPGKWVDAGTFLKRGETVIPLLQHDRRVLQEQLEQERRDRAAEVAAIRENVQELVSAQVQQTKEAGEKRLRELRLQLVEARQGGDASAEIEIEERIDKTKEDIRAAAAKAAKPVPKTVDEVIRPHNPALANEIAAFKARNPWYETDGPLTAAANMMMHQLMQRPEFQNLGPRQRLDILATEMNRKFKLGEAPSVQHHVESAGSGGKEPRDTGARTYDNLPADAKAQVEKDAKKYVGPGKAFKTLDAWKDQFVKHYDWNS